MTETNPWPIAGPDVATITADHPQPLEALAAGDVPALVIRGAVSTQTCEQLVDRFVAEQLLYDPRKPIPDQFIEDAIPEGYYREGRNKDATFAWKAKTATGRRRIDIGTSLGYRGSDPDDFFAHSRETHELFAKLFTTDDDPIRVLYHNLQQLAAGKHVLTAREPDGRLYGPAIIRAHYGGYTYAPHFDSVRLREKREDFAVHSFEHQFAGVLVLQNTQLGDQTAQCVLHRCQWSPEVDPHLKEGSFHEYAERESIGNVQVVLQPGDLYFFNTRSIHEVPGIAGELPRIVLATFIGYSSDRDDIFVWS
ncbi:MAG: hypothetical protein H8E66_26150 [Planctomycetes bacterium]|nr:hypothetical protein [Planctomycetota bacterium]